MAFDPHAPRIEIFVEDEQLPRRVTQYVTSATWEESVDLTHELTLGVDNINGVFTDSRIFAEGNEIEIHLGYGPAIEFVGRGEIIRHLPRFGADGSILNFIARDRSWRMRKTRTDLSGGRAPEKGSEAGKIWETPTLGSVVRTILRKHSITPLIDPELSKIQVDPFIQKRDMDDYSVLRSLANIYDAEFYVTYVPGGTLAGTTPGVQGLSVTGEWVGFFRIPRTPKDQEKRYHFVYKRDPSESIIDQVSFEYGIEDLVSEISAWVLDPSRGDWVEISVSKDEKAESPIFSPATRGFFDLGEIDSMTRIKLAASGYSVQIATKPFRTVEEARREILGWFEKYRDSFVIATGAMVGHEKLKAGQEHSLLNVGARLSGTYYFSRVKHTYTPDASFMTDFSARKVIET